MRKWLLGAMCATFVVAASHDAGAFKDGNALLEYAESENEILNFLFIMYVAGVAAGARDVTIRWKVLGKCRFRNHCTTIPGLLHHDSGTIAPRGDELRGMQLAVGQPLAAVSGPWCFGAFPCHGYRFCSEVYFGTSFRFASWSWPEASHYRA